MRAEPGGHQGLLGAHRVSWRGGRSAPLHRRPERHSGAPTATPSITFVNNTRVVGGAQAINLRRWPNVEIRQNKISGPNLTRGILIVDGSTGATVTGHSTTSGHSTVEVDDSSRPGSHVDANGPA